MRPRGPQAQAKMGSRRAPWRRLGGLGPLGSSPGALLGGLGRLLARSGRLLEPSWGLLGRSWGLPGGAWGSFGPPWGLLLELFGPLLKASLRYCENHENRRQYSTFCCFSRSRPPQKRSKIHSKSLPSSSGHLSALPEASWGCLGPLWACPGAVCVAPGPSLGGSRPVGNHRPPRKPHQGESKSCLAVKS